MRARLRGFDPLVWLTVVGCAARLAFVLAEPASRLAGDEITWTRWACGPLEGLTAPHVRFSPFRFELVFYPPLYPYVIASLVASLGSLTAVKLVQALLGALLIPPVGRLGTRLAGRPVGLAAAAIVALYPDLIWYTGHFWSETLFLTLTWWGLERLVVSDATASVETVDTRPGSRTRWRDWAPAAPILAGAVALVWGHDLEPAAGALYLAITCAGVVTLGSLGAGLTPARRAAVWAGTLFGLAILTRETLLYFAPVAVLWLAWRRVAGRRRAALFLTPLVLVVAPWTYRNYVVTQALVPVATSGALNLWQGNTRLPRAEVYTLSETVRGPGHVRVAQQRFHQRLALEAILERQPYWLAEKLASEMPAFWEADSLALIHLKEKRAYGPYTASAALALAVVVLVPYLAVLVLGVAGVLRVPTGRLLGLLVLFLVFYNGLHIASHGFARYRLPIMPIVILLAAAGLVGRPPDDGPSRRRRLLALTLAVTLALSLLPSLRRHWNDPGFRARPSPSTPTAPTSPTSSLRDLVGDPG